ncbi:MAG: OmpA family protein [candidate division KSB1 bacterium]|nr:OmpA family protein [candidate division KSB1 bacterium]MDZ7301797.1 OmpA family protein [candidate division KSB1 bacterium]MDZ7311424.1 OmpA family protein [candidate division KSB1 bacterium]
MFKTKVSGLGYMRKMVVAGFGVMAPWLLIDFAHSQEIPLSSGTRLESKTLATDSVDTMQVINLGSKVNSAFGDYRPRISTDGKTIYFCRKIRDEKAEKAFYKYFGMSYQVFSALPDDQRESRVQKVISKMDLIERLKCILEIRMVDGQEEIYVSHLENGDWTEAVSAGSVLNSEDNHEGPESISTDNNQFFIFKGGDIYLSRNLGTTWGVPQKLEKPINSDSWDADICFSADGMTLFFASQRPGFTTSATDTAKNIDIWVTTQKEGQWTEPVNLGPIINTPKTDRTPFLHADGKTLYFASDGHPGKGGLDLFKTTRLSDSSWTQWSVPTNLARLNTPDNDWDLTMPANSEWAYFSSEKSEGFGKNDIYKVRVDSTIEPARSVTLISGIVTSNNGEPLEAEIRWEDLATGKQMGIATSNPMTGEYTIALPAGRRYGYYATKENYWDKSENIDLTNLRHYKETKVNIQLIPIAKVAATETAQSKPPEIVLKNIFFDFDSANLREDSNSELNRLAEKLAKYHEISIEIQGHTDSVGTDAYNKELSEKRAHAVKDYLLSKGISPKRLMAVGYGEDRPIASNATEEGRQSNRRVSFVQIQSVAKRE